MYSNVFILSISSILLSLCRQSQSVRQLYCTNLGRFKLDTRYQSKSAHTAINIITYKFVLIYITLTLLFYLDLTAAHSILLKIPFRSNSVKLLTTLSTTNIIFKKKQTNKKHYLSLIRISKYSTMSKWIDFVRMFFRMKFILCL